MDAWTKNAAGGKPMIMGEAGVGNGLGSSATVAGNNDTDTAGVWWHQFIWSQVNPGGMYFIYWYDHTLHTNHLYGLTSYFRQFMEGTTADTFNKRIPLNNGKYQDIGLSLPAGIYGWGQKDTVNGGAHFWMYDKNYTWLTPSGGASLAGKTISFGGMPNKTYTVEWWNTWDGTVISQDATPIGGTLTLSVPTQLTRKDSAAKIYPKGVGYPGINLEPSPPPGKTGDVNGDGVVNGLDLKLALSVWKQATLCQSFNCDISPDGEVNNLDIGLIIKNFGL
jgi:hypothetical protein